NEIPSVVTCGAFIVLGVSFLMSKKRLSEALCESQVMSSLLFEAFGIQKDLLNEQKGNRNRVYLLPVLFGLCFAALSYFVMPVWIAFVGLSLLAVLLILLFPELGVLVLMAVIPLASFVSHPSVLLLLLVGVTLFSYIVKLIRGKRVFKMKAVDFAVAGFAVIRFSSGFFAAGGSAALIKAVVDCGLLCAYFPVVNLMRSKEWLNRAKYTFLIFAAVAVLIGAFQSFGGGYESGWLDSSAFSAIRVRVTSTFGNPNVFASYILLVLPFAAVGVIEKNKPRHKIMSIFTLLLAVLCLVQTWSRGAWLGACVAAVVFAFVYSHKTVPCVFAVGITAILALPLVFPNISQRFVSIGNFAESSVSYRISAWQGILNMLKGNWIGGIGYGEASFSAVYPSFAYSGAESVRHSHSLYLQILTESGIIGLLAFGITVFLFLQNCFEYLYRVKEKEAGYMMIAGISAVVGFLVMGLADYVWYNSGILLAFWLTVALVNASVRVGISEMERYNESKINTELSMDIEVGLNNFQ
ncbi:MAG: O-antigen ligase family protein, partial [Clostridia bacterium]|nr:O-antigen ligase family protein [Clostridia bacterium]